MKDLEAFHRDSRNPRGGPWAVCLTRDDARTVSLTTVRVTRSRAIMTHLFREEKTDAFDPEAYTAHLPLVAIS